MHTGFWRGDMKERDHWEPRRRWENNIKYIFKKWDGETWTGRSGSG